MRTGAEGAAARAASRRLAHLDTLSKNRWLLAVAGALEQRQDAVLEANQADCADARENGLDAYMIDRLLLTPDRLAGMAADVRAVAALPDPVGEVIEGRTLPNGMRVERRRVPLGVIGTIYESRPNVTIDIASLAVKAGNAVILRGGKEARRSNQALGGLLRDAAAATGVPADAIQVVENSDRALVAEMLRMRDVIDLMVPRGNAELIRRVYEEATMPVVAGGIGVCHTYVDDTADVPMAVDIVVNAKCRRYSICNALDTVLVARAAASEALPAIARALAARDVELRCDPEATAIVAGTGVAATPARESDWGQEFLALVAAVKVVDGIDGALAHIERYGSGHSEAIVTESHTNAQRFLAEVDAAAVYVNASTQFTDGAQFGLGAEVGISTQKMHARGPLGLRELTSYKWVVLGAGHTRP
ncbi:MAG: glutamate-5-semialdehyde dehydrogenase [Dehalococcoidia bacterium]